MAGRSAFKAGKQIKTKTPFPSTTLPRSSSPVTSIKLQEMMDAYAEKIMLKVKQFTQELMKELEKQILERVQEIVMRVADHIDDVAERVDMQQKECEASHEKQEGQISKLQTEVTMLQFERMQFALRVRGLPEEIQENLKVKIASSIAPVLNCDQGMAMEELDSVYRVNSKVAEQKNLPRDVVVYFCRKACRNQVIQEYYQKKFQIANFDIILLKEVPTTILQKRKDFLFLTQELRRRKILFRWNIPMGLTVTFDNKRHKLNTVQEAKDFYKLLSNCGTFQSEGVVELSNLLKDSLVIQEVKDSQASEARIESTRVMTREMYRQKFSKKK